VHIEQNVKAKVPGATGEGQRVGKIIGELVWRGSRIMKDAQPDPVVVMLAQQNEHVDRFAVLLEYHAILLAFSQEGYVGAISKALRHRGRREVQGEKSNAHLDENFTHEETTYPFATPECIPELHPGRKGKDAARVGHTD